MTRSLPVRTSCRISFAFSFVALTGCGSGSALGNGGVVDGGGATRAGGMSARGGTTGTGGSVTGTGCVPGWTLCCGQCLSPSVGLCGPCPASGGASATGGTPSGGGISTGGFVGAGGNGGTVDTGSGNCTFVDGETPPAVDEVTGLQFSTATTIPSNPAPAVQVTVTDVAKSQNAYHATLALPVFPPGTYACPIDWGVTYQLTFLLANGSSLTVTADPNGCSLVDIPGTCLRSVGSSDYWSQLAQDLGIPESEIYPYSPILPVSQPDGGAGGACTTDSDCPAGLSCGYAVADGCVAKGVCVQSNFQGPVGPSEMCGCDGQGIVPVVVQGPSSSYTVFYASAPSSGKIGPCTGISVPDAATATESAPSTTTEAKVPLQHRSTSASCPSQRGPGPSCAPPFVQANPTRPAFASTCASDSQCTAGVNGRCFPFEGLVGPGGCSYDECFSRLELWSEDALPLP